MGRSKNSVIPSSSHISPAMHHAIGLRNLLLIFLAFICVLSYPSFDDASQDIDLVYTDTWQDTPNFQRPYQKRWANQVRFGKRSNNWASSVRFG